MFDPKLKERIIYEMCCTMRHDYDYELKLEIVDDDYLGGSPACERVVQGMRPEQKRALYNQMKQVFENCIERYFHVEISS